MAGRILVVYDYNLANDLTAIRENGATDWALAAYGHDDLGRRASVWRGNGVTSALAYDGRLASLADDAAGTDKLLSTVAYGTPGSPNNLLPTVVASGSGDGSLTATTVLTHSGAGDVATVDGPLPGPGDPAGELRRRRPMLVEVLETT